MSTPFEVEDALAGVLLHLPAPVVCEAASLVHAEDFADLRLAVVADVCRELAGRGVDPHPAAVLAHVRACALVTGVDALRTFTLLLADLYEAAPTPAGWRFYVVAVIEEALRRRCAMLGKRAVQAAEGASMEALLDLVDREIQAVHDVRDRRAVAAGDTTPARLMAVTA
ncbi:MAG: hypothetical protein M3Q22_02580 [Actinomycetota bacterium]|nr:hypothetical protein [Actinomycetota bacterium]